MLLLLMLLWAVVVLILLLVLLLYVPEGGRVGLFTGAVGPLLRSTQWAVLEFPSYGVVASGAADSAPRRGVVAGGSGVGA